MKIDKEILDFLINMPEIAEVRLIADGIQSFLKDSSIQSIEILNSDILTKYIAKHLIGIYEFQKALPLRVLEVNTHGKMTYIRLENEWLITIGFGMSGNIRKKFEKHCHLRIVYENTSSQIATGEFYYHDIRRFGHWNFSRSKLILRGYDPLKAECDDVLKMFRNFNHMNICKALMSQEMIAGVGNYIKAETLYESGIHPLAVIKNIDDEHLILLYKAIRKIAQDAYVQGGASLYTYTGIGGDKSAFKETLKVYNRKTDIHGNIVEKIPEKDSPDKRTTHWVPNVQLHGVTNKI